MKPQGESAYREIVSDFARDRGYITSVVMPKPELESLIDSGIDPEVLRAEILRRIDEVDGIVIGKRELEGKKWREIKYPDFLRDRHAYIIGKSGSGKTNMLRLWMLQDIYYGKGIGVLAPEQELITDDIVNRGRINGQRLRIL